MKSNARKNKGISITEGRAMVAVPDRVDLPASPREWDPENKSGKFLSVLPKSGNVLVTSHDNPDPDALASCMALQRLIQARTKLNPRIAIGGILGRSENQALSLELELDLYPIDILEHQRWDGIVMVDAQPGAGNSNLPRSMPIVAVIDHHPQRQSLDLPFVDIRPDYGASATISVEFLCSQGVEWDAKLATALYYAIKSETQDLGRRVAEADRRAHFALFDSVDWELMHRITKAKIPGDYFVLFQRGISTARLFGNALVADLGEIPTPDACAEIADFLLRHEQVTRSLVMGRYEDQIVFSIRFTRSDLDAGLIASGLARNFGTGGGHDQMAGGRIVLTKARQERVENIKDVIEQRFLEMVGVSQYRPGTPLLASTASLTGSIKP
jgi:nanoRNase/pAp phosphatase (c-di-AMP/oligoRNAs hydrolase)